MQSILVRVLIASVTAALSWYAFYWIALYFERSDAIFIANVLLGSVLLHELGHLLAFKRHGVKCWMFFLVILGGVAPLDLKQEKRLSSRAKAEVALAGMFGNIAAVLIAVALYVA